MTGGWNLAVINVLPIINICEAHSVHDEAESTFVTLFTNSRRVRPMRGAILSRGVVAANNFLSTVEASAALVFKMYERIVEDVDSYLMTQFLQPISQVKNFASATGQRYDLRAAENHLIQTKAGKVKVIQFDLKILREAFNSLQCFQFGHFKVFLQHNHSSGRSFLIHAGLLKHS